jgi:hypothetical protein
VSPGGGFIYQVPPQGAQAFLTYVGTKQINIATTTIVYLVAYTVFASGSAQGRGYLNARRMR